MSHRFNNLKKLKLFISAPRNNSGFTLLEVMAAIFVVTVGLIGVFATIQNISIQTSYSSNKLIASYLAQEGMEIIRNIRDTNWLEQRKDPENPNLWNEGFIDCTTGCEIDYFCATVEKPTFSDPAGHNCLSAYGLGNYLKINSDGFYNYASGTNTQFKRKMIVTGEGADILRVEAIVSWQERGKNYEFRALEKLYNWR